MMRLWKEQKNVLNCVATDREHGTSICEYIFPELKESEDEKIRKAMDDAGWKFDFEKKEIEGK